MISTLQSPKLIQFREVQHAAPRPAPMPHVAAPPTRQAPRPAPMPHPAAIHQAALDAAYRALPFSKRRHLVNAGAITPDGQHVIESALAAATAPAATAAAAATVAVAPAASVQPIAPTPVPVELVGAGMPSPVPAVPGLPSVPAPDAMAKFGAWVQTHYVELALGAAVVFYLWKKR
jgi:hypothetical protein